MRSGEKRTIIRGNGTLEDEAAMKPARIIAAAAAALATVFYAAVCYHSVEEIHYLKSFYPREFTVEEAFYASGVELVKVLITGLPVGIFVLACALYATRGADKKGN